MIKLISPELIQKAKEFHGHWCPGLAVGIRLLFVFCYPDPQKASSYPVLTATTSSTNMFV